MLRCPKCKSTHTAMKATIDGNLDTDGVRTQCCRSCGHQGYWMTFVVDLPEVLKMLWKNSPNPTCRGA